MNWVSENLGWLIGTKAHCEKKRYENRPEKHPHESDVDHAMVLITYEDKFNRSYRNRAYIKRSVLIILLVMLFTNPGLGSFKEYQLKHYDVQPEHCFKKRDYLFFSTYGSLGHTFIGAFTTFFLTSVEGHPVAHGVTKQDSVYNDPSTEHTDTFAKRSPLIMPALDTGANHHAAHMDSVIQENNKPNPFAQPEENKPDPFAQPEDNKPNPFAVPADNKPNPLAQPEVEMKF